MRPLALFWCWRENDDKDKVDGDDINDDSEMVMAMVLVMLKVMLMVIVIVMVIVMMVMVTSKVMVVVMAVLMVVTMTLQMILYCDIVLRTMGVVMIIMVVATMTMMMLLVMVMMMTMIVMMIHISAEGKELFTRPMSAPPGPMRDVELGGSGIKSPDLDVFLGLRPGSREAAVQTPEPSPNPSPEPPPVIEDVMQSSVNGELHAVVPLGTSMSSNGDEREKRHSVHSAHTSGGSVSSREDFDKRYSLGGQEVIVALSDGEGKSDKAKVKKSKSFLQKHGDKIKSKLSFRKKSKPKVDSGKPVWENKNM